MKKHLLLIASLGLTLGLNIYFRTFAINFPQLKIQAKQIVENNTYQNAAYEIEKIFPETNVLAKDTLIKAFISNYKKQKKEEIKKNVEEEYLKLKDRFQDTDGQTYLMELDCWHWGHYVDNISKFGRPGDKIVNDKQWDNLMLAPGGTPVAWNQFLYYLSAFLYKLFSLIKAVPLNTFLFYLPLFFSAIFIIVLYILSFSCCGHLTAQISCLFVGLAPIFLPRSCAGWFDTDILNLLFPLLIIGAYLGASDNFSFKRKAFWIFISCFWLGLFCFTWPNWWFIFLIIIIYEIFSLANIASLYLERKEKNLILFKRHVFCLFAFLLFSIFWIILFSGIEPLLALYHQIKNAIILTKPLSTSIWPNVYTTVGELRKADYSQIAQMAGGMFLFISSLLSLLWLFLRYQRYTGFKNEFIVIMVFWCLSMLFACFKGIRFIMFLLVPLGISLGWVFEETSQYLINKNKKGIVFTLTTLIILGTIFISNAASSAKTIFPMMNDNWYRVLTIIKETTPKKAIINSWWDFGDWFKTVSGRRVIFDGQSQNGPLAYWMGRILTANNEEEAIRILRMLNNGGNKAFEIIDAHIKEPFKSIMLLEKIILKSREPAKNDLSKFLPEPVAKEVIKLLFNKPQNKSYFIVDYTMLFKITPISYLGKWDFSKAYLTQNLNKKERDKIIDYLISGGKDRLKAEKLYQEAGLISQENLDNWVSQRLSFRSPLIKGQKINDTVLFDNGLIYNPKEKTIYLHSFQENRYQTPRSLFIHSLYPKAGQSFISTEAGIEEILYPKADLGFSVLILIDSKEEYHAVLLDRDLANSLFVRLYFLNGAGLKYFKPFTEEKTPEGNIRIFEIAWE
ncbi:MAG: STT3 domain-containing protein [Candidatus Omnitrophota bacterium]|nr:STT3 domain-containing protein [Candidatus Omnitrophota bacterium]